MGSTVIMSGRLQAQRESRAVSRAGLVNWDDVVAIGVALPEETVKILVIVAVTVLGGVIAWLAAGTVRPPRNLPSLSGRAILAHQA